MPDVEYYYVTIRNVTMYDRHLVKIVGASMVGNLRHEFQTDGRNTVYEEMKVPRNEKFTYTYSLRNKQQQKITQFHHSHVRLCDIYGNEGEVRLQGNEARLAQHLDAFNDIESTHATFMTYYHACDDSNK